MKHFAGNLEFLGWTLIEVDPAQTPLTLYLIDILAPHRSISVRRVVLSSHFRLPKYWQCKKISAASAPQQRRDKDLKVEDVVQIVCWAHQ
jgi:hypothetical protein